jgi:hypothetical protein
VDVDGETETHLSEGGDHSICGHDLIGDTTIHSKPPEPLNKKSRITCQHCRRIIDLVKAHLAGQLK